MGTEWDGRHGVKEEEGVGERTTTNVGERTTTNAAAEAMRRKWKLARARRQPERCGVDGCLYMTKDKSNLKKHQARMHGSREVEAEVLKRRRREWIARHPVQQCGVGGCEYKVSPEHASDASAKRGPKE
jgi:hypothetical protein